jgi:hypothetical protein
MPDTLSAVGITRAANLDFSLTVIFTGTALPCLAFAWDGLVRRQALLPAFPVGAALGQQAASLRRFGALALGLLALLAGAFCLLAAWALWRTAAMQLCQRRGALTCMGTLVGTVQFSAWGWFGLCLLWFLVVWLLVGDPRKRVLVPGVWYHQERLARQVNRRLCAQGMAPLPSERLYALEEGVVRVLRAQGWLNPPPAARANDVPSATRAASAPEQIQAVVQQEVLASGGGEAERAATVWLLDDFLAQAQHAAQMSTKRRLWVSRIQAAKLGVYGRRAL